MFIPVCFSCQCIRACVCACAFVSALKSIVSFMFRFKDISMETKDGTRSRNHGNSPTWTFHSRIRTCNLMLQDQRNTNWATPWTSQCRIRNCNLLVTRPTLYRLSYHLELPMPDSKLQPSSYKANAIPTELPLGRHSPGFETVTF